MFFYDKYLIGTTGNMKNGFNAITLILIWLPSMKRALIHFLKLKLYIFF
jgi:hypothetical protein